MICEKICNNNNNDEHSKHMCYLFEMYINIFIYKILHLFSNLFRTMGRYIHIFFSLHIYFSSIFISLIVIIIKYFKFMRQGESENVILKINIIKMLLIGNDIYVTVLFAWCYQIKHWLQHIKNHSKSQRNRAASFKLQGQNKNSGSSCLPSYTIIMFDSSSSRRSFCFYTDLSVVRIY